ncbi:MAG: hypothetical protein AABX47_09715 [Nanoarchaeota archaeon]
MGYSVQEIKKRILLKLVRWRKWGESHTENVLNGLPRHIRGEKETRQAIHELVQEGLLIQMMKTKEAHYSLNPKKAEEIKEFLDDHD